MLRSIASSKAWTLSQASSMVGKAMPMIALNSSASLIFQARMASTKAKKPKTKSDLAIAKEKLAKEKQSLKKLEAKLKEHDKKVELRAKERAKADKLKKDAKDKKYLNEAFKVYKSVSGYALFVKEHKSNKIGEISVQWQALPEQDKQDWKSKAKEYNDALLKVFIPKPKKPAEKFAAYLKQEYVHDGRNVTDAVKDYRDDWKSLSEIEKTAYDASQEEKDFYHESLKAWKETRLTNYAEYLKSKQVDA